MALTNGVYAIVAYLSPKCCTDNSYFSTQALNPQFLCGYAGSANQKMIVRTAESGVADENSVKIQQSGQYWYINCVAGMDNQVLKQYPKGQGAQNKELSWYFEDTGDTLEVNGNNLPVYLIKSGANRSYAINYKDSLASYLNALKITTITDSTKKYQQFVPIKTTQYDQNMVAPTIKIDGEINNVVSAKLNTPTAKTIRFSTGSKFQYRVRRSFLLHNTSTWAEDELYYSPTNQTTDYGYGDVWTNNAVAANTYTMESANNSPTLWSEPYDSVRYTFECRQYSSNGYGAIGGVVNTKTYTTSQKLNVSVNSVTISARDLLVDFNTDVYRDNASGIATVDILLNGESILREKWQGNLTLQEKVIQIDYEQVKKLPEEGDTVKVEFSFSSNIEYIESFSVRQDTTVSIESGTLKPNVAISNYGLYDVEINISEKTSKSFNCVYLSMIYEHDGSYVVKKIIDGEDKRKWYLACPFNCDYSLYCLIVKKSASGTIEEWGSISVDDNHKVTGTAVLLSENCEIPLLWGESSSWDIFQKSTSLSSDEVIFNGSRYKDKFSNGGIPTSATLSNVLLMNEDKHNLGKLKKDFYCLCRTSHGEYINCTINDVQFNKYCNGFDVITVSLDEVDRDVDVLVGG